MAELSPTVLTVIAGLSSASALQVHPTVSTAISKLSTKATNLRSYLGNTAPTLAFADSCDAVAYVLTSMSGNIWQGHPVRFGLVLQQILGHLSTAGTISSSTSFINSTAFTEYGTGITNVGSMATHGLDATFGNLSAAANVMDLVGPAYDLTDIKNFGSSVGLVKKLNQVKLGKSSGVNDALTANGVDITNLEDPVYLDMINRTLSSITDSTVLKDVVTQLKLTPASTITSLLDLTDITKLVPANQRTGLTASLIAIGQTFADMSASFDSPQTASALLRNISVPAASTLNSVTSITSLMTSLAGPTASVTGTGSNPNGLPNVTDFTQPVSGGSAINTVISSFNESNGVDYSTAEQTALSGITSMVANSTNLFSLAHIDLTQSPPIGLNTIVSFASTIGQFGLDTSGSNVANVIIAMTTSDIYGDAVKATISEAVNIQQMSAHGIKPLTFKG